MRLKFILPALVILPLLLPAAELKLPASKLVLERDRRDPSPLEWWYQLIPNGGEHGEPCIRLYGEDGDRCMTIRLKSDNPGEGILKGKIRFKTERSRLYVGMVFLYWLKSSPQVNHFVPNETVVTYVTRTTEVGTWQDFQVPLHFNFRKTCPDTGVKLIAEPLITLSADYQGYDYLQEVELSSLTLSVPGSYSIKPPKPEYQPPPKKTITVSIPQDFPGNRFDANTAIFSLKTPKLPEVYNQPALTDAQRISLNPDFELKLLNPFEKGERAYLRTKLRFPRPIDPGDPYPTPILADTCDGAFYAVMPNSREFFLAKFDPEKSRWETVKEHVTPPAPQKKDDPRLTTAEERFDRGKDSLTRLLHPDAPSLQPKIAVPETLLVNGGNGFASNSAKTPPAEFQSEKVRKLPVAKAWSSPGSSTLLLGVANELLWEWDPATGKATQHPLLCSSSITIMPQHKGFLFLQYPSSGAEIRYFPGDSQPSRLLAGTPFSARRATHLRNLPGGGQLPMESYLGLRGRYLIVSAGPKLALLDLLDPTKSLLLQGFEFRFALIRPDSDFIRVIAQEGMFDLRPKGGWGELTDADFTEVRDNFLTRNNLDSAKLVPLKKLITAVEATDPDLFRAEWKEFDGIDCLVLSWKKIPFNCEVKLDLDQGLLEQSPVMLYGFLPRQLSGATQRLEDRKILERVGCYVSGMFYSRFPESGIRLSKGNTLKFCMNQTDSAGELILAAVGK